jgi:3-oxoacyl-[acyl-carrier protein] reductase
VEGCSRGEAGWEAENYTHHQVDVASEKDVRAMVASVAKRHGRVDIVLNNAAVASMNHVLLTPAKASNRMLEVNVTGTMLFCRETAKVMMRRKYGRIVNFTTIVAPIALAGEAIYAASKAAVVTFTRILAFELGQWGITCNSFGATPIMTDMIRGVPQDKIDAVVNNLAVKRLGTYEDCSNVCDFFISPASDNITGQVIYLGGVT